jgi:type II secretory pathway pseudopilin PulG
VVTAIAGILAGFAIPTAIGARQNATVGQAMAELRLLEQAINSSCSRGRCGPFTPPGAFGGTVQTVPPALIEFLPSGYRFPSDTGVYALEMESWEFNGATGMSIPMCVSNCVPPPKAADTLTSSSDDPGWVNTAGFAAPPTMYVSVSLLTRQADMAQRLFDKAGGAPPIYDPSAHAWRYTFPVLVGVLAVD